MSALLGGEYTSDPDGGFIERHIAPTAPHVAPAGGAAGAPPTPIRKMPVRTRRVDLDGDYEGWWVTLRTNAPFGLYLALTELQGAGDDGAKAFARLAELLPSLIMGWNFVDEQGQPIACDAAGLRAIPTDLLMSLVGKLAEGETIPKA